MKELSIDEKTKTYDGVKAYNEAIERAKELLYVSDKDSLQCKTVEHIFPELKESEDEKIKRIIKASLDSYFGGKLTEGTNDVDYAECLAWLEKQGRQDNLMKALQFANKTIGELTDENYYLREKVEPKFKVGDEIKTKNEESFIITRIDRWGYWSEDLFICSFDEECIWDLVEQKPADKVEPKFKVGDWVVDKNGTVQQILSYKNSIYKHTNGYSSKMFEDVWRLWDITKDAKDGDVLAYKGRRNNVYICIFKEYVNERVYDYCTLDKEIFWEYCNWNYLASFSYTPATKEQRDQLEKAMTDAGYTFDFEKKELKKISNALEECEIVHIEHGKYYYCIKDYYAGGNKRASKGDVVQALNGMSMMALGVKANEYFIPVNTIKQMSAWSEEDEAKLKSILFHIEDVENKDVIDWLKSLRPQNKWKPSESQLETLHAVSQSIRKHGDPDSMDDYRNLTELYNELVKLM